MQWSHFYTCLMLFVIFVILIYWLYQMPVTSGYETNMQAYVCMPMSYEPSQPTTDRVSLTLIDCGVKWKSLPLCDAPDWRLRGHVFCLVSASAQSSTALGKAAHMYVPLSRCWTWIGSLKHWIHPCIGSDWIP